MKNYLNIDLYNKSGQIYMAEYPFYIATVGESIDQSVVHRPAGIKDYQLLYTVSGTGIGIVDGREQTLDTGSIFLLPPFTPHEYYKRKDGWHTLWITFGGTAAQSFLGRSEVLCKWKGEKSFEEMHNKILKLKNSLDFKRCSMALYELLIDFHDFSNGELLQKRQIKNKIFPAIKYMTEHYTEDINIEQIANTIGVTDSHFCRLFKDYSGVRPMEYIASLRIAMAKMLIANAENMNISEIGEAVGYKSESYFIFRFKQSQGITPDEFRKRLKTNFAEEMQPN